MAEVRAMGIRKLDRSEWGPTLDEMTRARIRRWAELEISSLDVGSQVLARDMELVGVTYDAPNDLIEINLEGLDHLVRRPREVFVDGPPVSTLAVRTDGGALQIVRMREPRLLPQS
jgi:hypothetical protein